MRNDTKRLSWKAGLVAGVLLALSPALAVAQQAPAPYAMATLYEVREDINCNPGDSTAPDCADGAKGFGVRIADATLTGNIFSQTQTEFVGPVTLDASSILNQRDWTGPAHGKIMLQNGVRATFSGQLNLSLAMLGTPPAPLAPLSGKWQGTKGTLHAGGDFSGVFVIPVPLGCSRETAPGCFYLQLDAEGRPTGQFLPLQPEEYTSAGAGLVKLMVVFFNN